MGIEVPQDEHLAGKVSPDAFSNPGQKVLKRAQAAVRGNIRQTLDGDITAATIEQGPRAPIVGVHATATKLFRSPTQSGTSGIQYGSATTAKATPLSRIVWESRSCARLDRPRLVWRRRMNSLHQIHGLLPAIYRTSGTFFGAHWIRYDFLRGRVTN